MKRSTKITKIIKTKQSLVRVIVQRGKPDKILIDASGDVRLGMKIDGEELSPVPPTIPRPEIDWSVIRDVLKLEKV